MRKLAIPIFMIGYLTLMSLGFPTHTLALWGLIFIAAML